jgi:hypothetical protein
MTLGDLQTTLRSKVEAGLPALNPAEMNAYVEAALRAVAASAPDADQQRRIDSDLLRSDVAYAIPDDALNLFPALVQAAIGAFANGPVGALSELAGILFRYRSLRIELAAEEAAVLRVLRAAKLARQPPLPSFDIHQRLDDAGLALQRPLNEVLAGLKGKNTDKTTLVVENGGRWAVGNI